MADLGKGLFTIHDEIACFWLYYYIRRVQNAQTDAPKAAMPVLKVWLIAPVTTLV